MEQRDRELNEKALWPATAAVGVLGGLALGYLATPPVNTQTPTTTQATTTTTQATPVASPTIPPVASQTPTSGFGPYTRAMLDTISDGEGTSKYEKGGYNTLFGGAQVEDLTKHPKTSVLYNRGRDSSNAFGRYQIIGKTYDWLKGESMHPEEQDRMAVKLLQYRLKVKTPEAVEEFLKTNKMSQHTSTMLSREWASFPGDDGNSVYRAQSVQRLEKLQSHWDKNILKHKPAVVPVTTPPVVQEYYKDRARRYLREMIEPSNPIIDPVGTIINHSDFHRGEGRSRASSYGHSIPILNRESAREHAFGRIRHPKIEDHQEDIEVSSIGTTDRNIPSDAHMVYEFFHKGYFIHRARRTPEGSMIHEPMAWAREPLVVDKGSGEDQVRMRQGKLLDYLNMSSNLFKSHAERLIREHDDTMVDIPAIDSPSDDHTLPNWIRMPISKYHQTKFEDYSK